MLTQTESPVEATALARQLCDWRSAGHEVVVHPLTRARMALSLSTRFNPLTNQYQAMIGKCLLFDGLTEDQALGHARAMLRNHFKASARSVA